MTTLKKIAAAVCAAACIASVSAAPDDISKWFGVPGSR